MKMLNKTYPYGALPAEPEIRHFLFQT